MGKLVLNSDLFRFEATCLYFVCDDFVLDLRISNFCWVSHKVKWIQYTTGNSCIGIMLITGIFLMSLLSYSVFEF